MFWCKYRLKLNNFSLNPDQAGALLAGLILSDAKNISKAVAVIEPLTCLFGGMYLGSLGMILSPVCSSIYIVIKHMIKSSDFHCLKITTLSMKNYSILPALTC